MFSTRLISFLHNIYDGTPCTVKAARTVWSGGKVGDNFKNLPIIVISSTYRLSDMTGSLFSIFSSISKTKFSVAFLFRLLYNFLVNSCVCLRFYFTPIVRFFIVRLFFFTKFQCCLFLSATASFPKIMIEIFI